MDLREGYFFAAPHRSRTVYSETKPSQAKPKDAAELNTSFAFEMCGDFPTVMESAFFPRQAPWVVSRAGPMVPDESKEQVELDAAKQDGKVFKSILASNFYAEYGKTANPDLGLGVIALWIEHPVTWMPPEVQAVPIRELEINIGPKGTIDDRFVVRHTRFSLLGAVLPGIKIPKEVSDKYAKNKNKSVVVVWGFWRIYDDSQEEKWQHVVTIDKVIAHEAVIKGPGACPLVIGRMGACPEWAWATGPLIQALPDLRQIDDLAEGKIANVDMNLRPPISFPDDSFANISDGIESGMAYAIRPGTESAIKNIYDPPPPDPAIYITQDLEQRVKRLFFLDWPQQDGKTPPTATQWLDEMTLAQRRIGTPGEVFWSEFCAGTFLRFRFLLEKAGQIQPVTMTVGEGEKAQKKPVALMPYNPAQRGAEQEEVALFSRFAQIGAAAFPEEWKVVTDGKQTLSNIANKMGVNDIWAKRKDSDVANAIGNMSKMLGGAAPGGPAMPQGAAPPADLAGAAPPQPRFSFNGGGE